MEGIDKGVIMLPDPNVFKGFALDAIYAMKSGWLSWRIARLERKNDKLRIKQSILKRAGGAH